MRAMIVILLAWVTWFGYGLVAPPTPAAGPAAEVPAATRYYRDGLTAKRAGRLDAAAEAFRHALELRSDYPEARLALAWTALAQGDEGGAIDTFREVVKLAPGTPQAQEAVGALGRLHAAVEAPVAPPPSIVVQAAPELRHRADEVLLQGNVVATHPLEGRVELKLARVERNRKETRFDPPETASLLLSAFGQPPAVLPTNPATWLKGLTTGAGLALVVKGASGPSPAVATCVEVAVTGQTPGRVGPPWPEMTEEVDPAGVEVPMIFPVLTQVDWHDTFQQMVVGQRHTGQDLRAPRMTPLVAVFDGVVWLEPKSDPLAANSLVVLGDNGWEALYAHLNNDTPDTKDNAATLDYAFAPGIVTGARVAAGQLLGYVGDSGQATGPHLHLELRGAAGGGKHKLLVNSCASLQAARVVAEPVRVRFWPELRPREGETRLEGYVDSVDPAAGLVVLRIRHRDGVVTSWPTKLGVRLAQDAPVRLLGAEGASLTSPQLRPGQPVIVLGTPAGGRVTAREAWVEVPGVVASPAVMDAVAGR